MLEAEIIDNDSRLEANIEEPRATKEIYYVTLDATVTHSDKTASEIYEAAQAGKYAVARYFYSDEFNIVPFTLINENEAQCQILFDDQIIKILIDNQGNVSGGNVDLATEEDIENVYNNVYTKSQIDTKEQNVIEIAEGKTKTFTLAYSTEGNESFNSQNDSITVNSFVNTVGETITYQDVKVGDIILVLEVNVPDRWVQSIDEYNGTITLYKMETSKIDLTDYVKFTDYATSSKGGVIKTNDAYATKVDSNGILYANSGTYWNYENVLSNNSFISKGTLENVITGKGLIDKSVLNLIAGIMIPDTTYMTPIKTIEYDVSGASYYKFASILNDFTSFDEVDSDALFRITTTGTGIAKNVCEGVISLRQATNFQPFFVVRNKPGIGALAAANTGIRYLRVCYPKGLNSGYNWDFDFNPINNTARHIKIEVFKTSSNITWYNELTASTYNSSGQTGASLTLSTSDTITGIGNFDFNVASATTAQYVTSYLQKFINGTMPTSGEATLAHQFIFMSDDNKLYASSNSTKPIEPSFGLQLNATASNNGGVPSHVNIRQKYNEGTLTNIPHATLSKGKPCYFRCTMDANGNIYSDNYVDTQMQPGYTWYLVGFASGTNAIMVDTTQSSFKTLDANGILTHIDGLPLASNGNGVSY